MSCIYLILSLLLISHHSGPHGIREKGEQRGERLFGEKPMGLLKLKGDYGTMTRIAAEGQDFPTALRIVTDRETENVWDFQLSAKTVTAIRSGDVLHASLWVRNAGAPRRAAVEFVFEKAVDPWTKLTTFRIEAGSVWEKYDISFQAADSYDTGEAQLCLRVGFGPQIIDIGGLEVINYRRSRALSRLPVSLPTYHGQDLAAAWRLAAAERIEANRKGNITVQVIDTTGNPVVGAEVEIAMQRHSYAFGSAINARYLLGAADPDGDRYVDTIVRLFNRVVLEDALKWPRWESDRQTPLTTVEWLRDNAIEIRGHCLVWPGWRNLPGDLYRLKDDRENVRSRVLNHIIDEVTALKGSLIDWDVVNEPYSAHDIIDILGPSSMVEWFNTAREIDSAVTLYINDFDILEGGAGDTAHRRHFENTIRYLTEHGAPLGGIGVQCHFGNTFTPPEDLLAILDRFAAFGLPIQVTEFDMNTGIDTLEAIYMRDFMTSVFSHPATTGIMMWGFWDGMHWHRNAPLYRRDWSLKPSGRVWMELVYDQWWTQERSITDAQGRVQTRGFFGEYAITVTLDTVQTTTALRAKKDTSIVVTLPR